MKTLGTFMAIGGLVIIACEIYELVTDSLTTPVLLLVGPLNLVGGIVIAIRASRKGCCGKGSENKLHNQANNMMM